MRHLILVISLLAIAGALLSVPAAKVEAARSGVRFSNAQIDCSAGLLTYDIELRLFEGVRVRRTETVTTPGTGPSVTTQEITIPTALHETRTETVALPLDGSRLVVVEVFGPAGTLLTTAEVFGSCPDGTVYTRFIDGLPGQLPPPPDRRVMALVLFDTPVFAVPNPDHALEAVLLKDQTWFVVGARRAHGRLWFRVFTGGPQPGWVPAAAMKLIEPIPLLEEFNTTG